MEKILAVTEGGEAVLELFNANGVDYIFMSPGTIDPILEAYHKYKALGKHTPEIIMNLQES